MWIDVVTPRWNQGALQTSVFYLGQNFDAGEDTKFLSSFSDVSSCFAISLNLLWKCLSADFIWELENQPVWRDMKVKFGCSDNSHFCLICKLCTSAEKWNSVIVKRKEYLTFMLMVKSFKKHCTRDWRETLLK